MGVETDESHGNTRGLDILRHRFPCGCDFEHYIRRERRPARSTKCEDEKKSPGHPQAAGTLSGLTARSCKRYRGSRRAPWSRTSWRTHCLSGPE